LPATPPLTPATFLWARAWAAFNQALCEDLSVMEIASSHIDGINDVAFGTHSDTFATISRYYLTTTIECLWPLPLHVHQITK
jgi:hypothetical protein